VAVNLDLNLTVEGAKQVVQQFQQVGAAGQQAGQEVAKGAKKGEEALKRLDAIERIRAEKRAREDMARKREAESRSARRQW